MSKKSTLKYFQKQSCINKVSHTSLIDGINVLLKQRAKGYDVNNVYKCFFCNKYHIGHYTQKNRLRVKKIFTLIGELHGN